MIMYKVYCEKPGGSYHPDQGDGMYEYETKHKDVALDDPNAWKVVMTDDAGKEQVLFDLSK
jgi:hypothetical protein